MEGQTQTGVIRSIEDLDRVASAYRTATERCRAQVFVCAGAGCVSSRCADVKSAVEAELQTQGLADEVLVRETGCMGICAVGPVLLVLPDRTFYARMTPEAARDMVRRHLRDGRPAIEYTFFDESLQRHVPCYDDIDFFRRQVRIALRNCGWMDYRSLAASIARDGYRAAAKVLLSATPGEVVEEVARSGLKGRGGAGFPTGVKWKSGLLAKSERKFLVCNADEGDPGAFMDRSILEGDPHSVIEGMLIGGYAIGARQGYIYVRAEYPLAVERVEAAITEARQAGLLGVDILGSGFGFDIEVRIGAGAFVCGEETALIASVEGRRGEPRQKPPFPFQKGLFGEPTIINNVETLASIPPILLHGGAWYAQYGTEKSKGTKVFALAGNVVNTGIVEVPVGTPIGDILFDLGGGMQAHKKFKAAQIGGPSGGCITPENLNVPAEYDTLTKLGAIMGSGGLIAMDEDTCMVDTARFFMDFIRDESCGKCVACRIGTKRMLEILERITRGAGCEGDIELLEELGETIRQTAMCGLGQTAPNPVLSTIRYFRDEYEEHIRRKTCRAGVCGDLFLSPCANACPAHVNVPGYLSLVAAGRIRDAYNLIRQENPFPAVCGRICTRPCEAKCRRGTTDEPVAICDVKRFVADWAFRNEAPFTEEVVAPRNGKKVAVIGAGASGLTCAWYLARTGYDVDVFEAQGIAGGVLAIGIPEYRLPKEVLAHEIALIERAGVRIRLGTEIGRDITFRELRSTCDAVYVTTGALYPQQIGIPGETLPGVMPGIEFLRDVNFHRPLVLGKTMAVIGGGNTAVDSARTALRLGAEKVMILYRRNRGSMPAYLSEIEEAEREGVEIMELVSPVRLVSSSENRVEAVECVRMRLGAFDKAGRRTAVPIEGTNFLLPVDTVVPAVSQHADLPFVKPGEIGTTSWGTFVVDEDSLMTTVTGVFAGGDVARGPDTVIRAIADGKQAAVSIDRYLGGTGQLNKGAPIDIPDVRDEDEVVALKRFPLDMLAAEKRRNSFDEVVLGYHKLTAMAEAMRCLHCDRR